MNSLDPIKRLDPHLFKADKPKSKKDSIKAATQALKNQPNQPQNQGFWDTFVSKAKHKFWGSVFEYIGKDKDRLRDQTIFQAVFSSKENPQKKIAEAAPRFALFLAPLSEKMGSAPVEGAVLLNTLLNRIVANQALSMLSFSQREKVLRGEALPENERLTMDQILMKSTEKVVDLIGSHFNRIDARIVKGSGFNHALFLPVAEKLYDLLLPPDDNIRTSLEQLPTISKEENVKEIAANLQKVYKMLSSEIEGPKSSSDPDSELDYSPIQKELAGIIRYFLKTTLSSSYHADRATLSEIMGSDELDKLMHRLSPEIFEKIQSFLPAEVLSIMKKEKDQKALKNAVDALILHTVVSFSKDMQKEGKDLNYAGILDYFLGKVKVSFEDQNFSELTLNLIQIPLPVEKFKWLHPFIERRKDMIAEPLNQILQAAYHMVSSKNDISDSKERLYKLAKSNADVDRIVDFCQDVSKLIATKIFDALFTDFKQHRNLIWGHDMLAKALESILFQAIAKLLDKAPLADNQLSNHLLFAAFKEGLSAVMGPIEEAQNQLYVLYQAIQDEYQGIEDPIERSQLIENALEKKREELGPKLLNPFADALFKFIALPKEFPLDWVKEAVANESSKILFGLNGWMGKAHLDVTRLNALYPSKNPLKACNLLGAMTQEGIPYYLRYEGMAIAKDLIPQDERLSAELGQFLKLLGKDKSKEMQQFYQFIGLFGERCSLHVMADFSERMVELEKGRGDKNITLLEEVVLELLKKMTEHLENLGNAKQLLRNEGIENPNQKQILKKFAELKVLRPEQEIQEEKEAFFKKTTEAIFNVMGVHRGRKLPVPEDFQEPLWSAIENKMVPMILGTLFETMIDPQLLNSTAVHILQQVAAISSEDTDFLDKMFPSTEQIMLRKKDRTPKYKDPYQKDLENAISELVRKAVYLQPNLFPRYLVNKDSLREDIGSTMARPARDYIHASSLELFDKMMEIGLDAMAPSVWNEEKQKPEYISRSGELREKPKLYSLFPTSRKAREKIEKRKEEAAKKAEKDVPKFLMNLTQDVVGSILTRGFLREWDRVEEWVWSTFPKHSKFIIPVLNAVVKLPVYAGIAVLGYIGKLFAAAIIKLFWHQEMVNRARDIQSGTLANFLYPAIETSLEKLMHSQRILS